MCSSDLRNAVSVQDPHATRGFVRAHRQEHEIGDASRERQAVTLVRHTTRAILDEPVLPEDLAQFDDAVSVHQKSVRRMRQQASSHITSTNRNDEPIETQAL